VGRGHGSSNEEAGDGSTSETHCDWFGVFGLVEFGWLVAKTSIKCKVQQAVVTTVASVVVRAELRRVREGGKRLRVFMSFFQDSG
jgi:hypothetical protein